jgi:hypothetical protein
MGAHCLSGIKIQYYYSMELFFFHRTIFEKFFLNFLVDSSKNGKILNSKLFIAHLKYFYLLQKRQMTKRMTDLGRYYLNYLIIVKKVE